MINQSIVIAEIKEWKYIYVPISKALNIAFFSFHLQFNTEGLNLSREMQTE